MTPTEQDKEIREAMHERMIAFRREDGNGYVDRCIEHLDSVMQLITADRRRVALEARKDQTFKVIQSLVKSGSISDSSSSRALMVFDAELKAQQEEV